MGIVKEGQMYVSTKMRNEKVNPAYRKHHRAQGIRGTGV